MYDTTKHWWESRTIWVQLIAVVFAIGAGFEWWPTNITQEEIVAGIMGVVGLLTIILRIRTTKEIEPAPVINSLKGSAGTKR